MIHVDTIEVDDDEGRFILRLWLDEDPVADAGGRIELDIHSVAIELLDAAEKEIGPYRAEANAARREFETGRADDPTQQKVLDGIRGDWHSRKVPAGGDPLDEQPWPGESAMDYYQRTGDDEPLREQADHLRKAEREGS